MVCRPMLVPVSDWRGCALFGVAVFERFGVHRALAGGLEGVDGEVGVIFALNSEGGACGIGWAVKDMGGQDDTLFAIKSVLAFRPADVGADLSFKLGGGVGCGV